jgi:hypothetical protein
MNPIKILLQTTIPTTADAQAMTDAHRYMRNLALWLAGRTA